MGDNYRDVDLVVNFRTNRDDAVEHVKTLLEATEGFSEVLVEETT